MSNVAPAANHCAPGGNRTERIGRLVGGGILVFFLTDADVYFDSQGRLPIASSALFSVCALAILGVSLVRRPGIWRIWSKGFRSRELVLYPLILLALVTLVGALSSRAYWGDGAKNVLLTFFDVWVVTVAMMMGMLDWVRRSWRAITGTALVVLVATIAWDLLHPGSFSNQLARGAGLGVNSNDSAFFTALLTASTLRYERVCMRDVLLLAIGTGGVFFTLSRGGIVLQLLLIMVYVAKAAVLPALQRKRGAKKGIGLLVLVFVLVLSGVGAIVGSSPMFERATAKNRVAILLGQESVLENDEKRVRLVDDYLDMISQAPLLGNGAGFVARQVKGPHNMFLYMWVEKGIFGLLAYVGWLAACGYYFFRRSFFVGLVLVGLVLAESMFSHNVMDFRVFLVAVGVAVGVATSAADRQPTGLLP